MQHLFSGAQLHAASLTGAGLIVTLVLAAIILAAAVFAVISIVKRRKQKKGRCHGCGGSCSSCGMRCSTDRDKNSSSAEKADKTFQESTIRTSTFSDLNKSGKQ